MEAIKRKYFLLRLVMLSLALFLGISTLVLFKLNKDFLMLWNANTLQVEVEDGLELEKIQLYYGPEVLSQDATELLPYISEMDKIYDGKQIMEIACNYGPNDFILLYDNTYIASFSHWKFNRRHQHDYSFLLKTNPLGIAVDFEADGQDGGQSESQMLLLRE